MWVRGLKLVPSVDGYYDYWVAPRVGAWIETLRESLNHPDASVAPRVGAWIETLGNRPKKKLGRGRTPCGCVD